MAVKLRSQTARPLCVAAATAWIVTAQVVGSWADVSGAAAAILDKEAPPVAEDAPVPAKPDRASVGRRRGTLEGGSRRRGAVLPKRRAAARLRRGTVLPKRRASDALASRGCFLLPFIHETTETGEPRGKGSSCAQAILSWTVVSFGVASSSARSRIWRDLTPSRSPPWHSPSRGFQP